MDSAVQASSNFGGLLRRHRLAAGLSQAALAERARMSLDGVSALERGHRRTPQRGTLALLVRALALNDEERLEFEAAARLFLPSRIGAGSVTTGPWGTTTISNLPLALTSFVGRESDVIEVKGLLERTRLLTLVGSGGIGKTRLALHVGAELLNRYPDGGWFVDLAAIAEPERVASVIAQTLGISQQKGRRVDEAIARWLRQKSLLLILDNCEHLVKSVASTASSILNIAPDVRILATSRQALCIGVEVVHRLPSLSFPSVAIGLKVAEALQYGALALFVDRACAVDTRFRITDDKVPAVAEICCRLDGIPLAIELAAARTKTLSISSIARHLNQRFRILTAGSGNASLRQKTLSATIDWSYELLTAAERAFFTRLGIFGSGFGLDAATSVCGGQEVDGVDGLALLDSLIDKSLVVADTSGEYERYRLFESTAAYALEKLRASGQQEALARRHAEYFRSQALAADERYKTGSTFAWIAGVEMELGNYRAALEWALTQGNDATLGGDIAGSLAGLWANAGLSVEGCYWIELALQRVSEDEQPRVAARLRLALAGPLQGKSKHNEAERALRLYELVGDARGVARAQHWIAFALFQMNRLDGASDVIARCLASSHEIGDKWGIADCLRQQANIEGARGNRGRRRELCAQALAAFTALGDEMGRALALNDMADQKFCDGDADEALRLSSESLELWSGLGAKRRMANCHANRAEYRIALGDLADARESAREGLRLARQEQADLYVADSLYQLAVLLGTSGDCAGAARLLGYVSAQYSELGAAQGCEALMGILRETLSEPEIEGFAAEAAAWSEERAVEEALKG